MPARRRSIHSRFQRQYELMQELALERIIDLLNRAQYIVHDNPVLANRYVEHARRLSMAVKVPIPPELKRLICHGCKQLIIPGNNMRFRIHNRNHYGTYLVVTCLSCGHITRYLVKGKACHHQSASTRNLKSKSTPTKEE